MLRLRAIPWLVLVAALATTAIGVYWRDRAVAVAAGAAVESAEGHFNDVVADHKRQITDAQREIEVVLLGATMVEPDAQMPSHVSDRLERLGALSLDGVRGFVVFSGSGEGTVVAQAGHGIDDAVLVPLAEVTALSSTSPNRPWVTTMTVDTWDFVLVGLSTPPAGSLMAVFDANAFILGDSDRGHHVMAQLSPTTATGSLVSGMSSMDEMSMDEMSMEEMSMDDVAAPATVQGGSDVGNEHEGDVVDTHSSPTQFASTTEVDIYGETWMLNVHTMEGFIDLPSSQEIRVLIVLGAALSLAAFVLVRRLVRARIAAEIEKTAAQHELWSNLERFDTGFERSPIGVTELDQSGVIVKANNAIAALLGLSKSELVGMSLGDFVAEEEKSNSAARLTTPTYGEGEQALTEVRYELNDGRELWVHQTVSSIPGRGNSTHALVQLVDITEQYRARDELQHQAFHDELTGLPNRALLDDRLERALSRGRRNRAHTAVIFIDVDRFKRINDSLGHPAGDELLVEVAQRLVDCARDSDTVARFGGDEFVLICENLATPSAALRIADRVRSTMTTPVDVDGQSIPVTLSLGIAVADGDDDAEALLRDADLAMYRAKESGRDRTVLFESEMHDILVDRLALENQLHDAIDNGQLRVFYQPLLDLGTNRVVGFEALVRWQHPTRGLILPNDFIPIAEHLGIMARVDAWVLRTAVTQLRSWSDDIAEADEWSIAVNASASNFADPSYPHVVRQILQRAGFPASRLTIEVTEKAVLANPEIANQVIGELRSAGVKIAIDDFGTGYASFSQVIVVAFDILKIDRSLIVTLADKSGEKVIHAVIQMAQSLGLTTVGEGVESYDDLKNLRELGLDQAQGYVIARPLPPGTIPTRFSSAKQQRAPAV